MKWVSAYGASQCGNRMYKMNVADRTFRTFVKLPFGGEMVRLILSSMYGTNLYVGAMTVASAGQMKSVTLHGEKAFTVHKNQHVLSDEIEIPVRDGEEIEIRTYFSKGVSISGNRLLRDTGNQLLLGNLFGDSGVKRFDWDVAGYAGVETYICCDGANDVHQPTTYACYPWEKIPTYEVFCEGFKELNRKARQFGIRCIGTSLTPFKNGLGYNDEKGVLRRNVNEWILTSGEYDAVFDLAKVISDPSDPDAMNPSFDSGDHLHFNVDGGQAIADAFPLEILK